MIVIIAEKPSVGKDIARVLGVTESKKGYMEGSGYAVTWAFGHLVALAMPEDYRAEKYTKDELPVIPDPFKLVPRKVKGKYKYDPDPAALTQLKLIKGLIDKCERIIVATDAGREGELIFRNIYHYLKCNKPFSRLWISSLTDEAIREGLSRLKDGKEYDSLYLAADARSKADWMVGINTSRALGFCMGNNNNSLGRVQTPTLAMICKRYGEHMNFKAQPYWEIMINILSGTNFFVKSIDRYFDNTEANSVFSQLKQANTAEVKKVTKTETTEQPPLLYDLAGLQKDANIRFGFSADKTLSAAQKLYEKKYITYPRTGSRYIPDDVFNTIPTLFKNLSADPFYGKYTSGLLSADSLNKKSVDAAKVTDHHAILITGIMPAELSKPEEDIYRLVVTRFIESFMPACKKNVTTIEIDCGGILFRSKGWLMKQEGWRSIPKEGEKEPEENAEENQRLPDIKEGDILTVQHHNMIQKKTKPQPLYTEAILLTAMETAGKELEDDQAREALKGIGIGTAATRAAIIETLLAREYIMRQKKNLIPTPKGMEIFKAVKGMRISDVEMTGHWEVAIEKIIQEPDYYDVFLKSMKVHTRQMTDEIINVNINREDTPESPYLCPKCKLGRMVFYPKIARCNNSKCKHIIYRKKNEVSLSDEQLAGLFKTGSTELINGFKNKMGQPFSAALVLDADCNLKYDFSDNYKKSDAKRKKQ